MILPILRWPDPRLSQICEPAVLNDELRQLAKDMLETMYAAPGRGLAGPQVGAMCRIFVMDPTWKEGNPQPVVMVNPEILSFGSEKGTHDEGCLSIPGPLTPIERPTTIQIRWSDLDGGLHEAELTGFAALCAQHEYDHLNGVLTLDRLSPEARAKAESEVKA